MCKVTKDYNAIKWNDYFVYDTTSPSGLRWKISRYRGQHGTTLVVKAGDKAGCLGLKADGEKQGWSVNLNHSHYKIHRIIWSMFNGSIDNSLSVDHLDGDPANNDINNLTLKTYQGNMQNKKVYKTNTSGFVGVSFCTNVNGRTYFKAHWRSKQNKNVARYFSCDKYGDSVAKEMAIAYRKEQIELLNIDGAMYTNR